MTGEGWKVSTKTGQAYIVVASTWRAYGTFEISEIRIAETDANMQSGALVPAAFSIGAMRRLEGHMPTGKNLGSDRLGINVYGGATARALSGMSDTDLGDMIRSTSRFFAGFEGGASVQVGNVLIDPHVTYLWPMSGNGKHVDGLTGAQVQIRLTFVLPWVFSGDGKS
jgi:hypothetical protein